MTTPILKVLRAKEILADPFAGEDRLSDREKQVARLAIRGHSTTEIAAELGVVPHTISVHLTQIRVKLGTSPRKLTRQMIERLEEVLQ